MSSQFNKIHRLAFLFVLVPALLLVGGCGSTEDASSRAENGDRAGNSPLPAAEGTPEPPPGSEKIAVIYHESPTAFNRAVQEGAAAAAEQFDRELEWHFSELEDTEDQRLRIRQAVDERVAGIVLCPFDPISLSDDVQTAIDVSIPIVVIERPIESGVNVLAFAGTDQFRCGELLATKVIEAVNKQGTIIAMGLDESHLASLERRFGFRAKLKYEDAIDVVYVNPSEPTEDNPQTLRPLLAAQLEQLKEVRAICCLTAGATEAALQILAERQEDAEAIALFGFGASADTAEALRTGKLQGVVLEDPYLMGFSGVMALAQHLQGDTIGSEQIATGEHYVDADSLSDNTSQRLLESNQR